MTQEEKIETTAQEEVLEEPKAVEETTTETEETEEEKEVYVVNKSEYKCFTCSKIIAESYIKKKVRCPYCGSKIIFKARTQPNTVKSR